MNIEDKVKEIGQQIAALKLVIETSTEKVKLLTKTLKAYERLIQKAKEIELSGNKEH